MSDVGELETSKYVCLETYKKDNTPVRTPVWFVMDDEMMYVVTREKTGKIKRLKNNKSVKIAKCTYSGKVLGKWISGTAEFTSKEVTERTIKMRKKKYGFMERVAQFVSKNKGDLVVFSIRLNDKSQS